MTAAVAEIKPDRALAAQRQVSQQPLKLLSADVPRVLAERAQMDSEFRMSLSRECRLAIDSALPATAAQIGVALHRLSLHYPDRKLNDREAQLIGEDWLDDLDGIPADLVDLAFKRWRTGPKCAFFPKAGEILSIVEQERKMRILLERRARDVIEMMTEVRYDNQT